MLICPKSPYVLICRDKPALRIPRPCGSYKCLCCRPAKVQERARLAAWGASLADKLRFVTLTKAPADWQQARMQVRDLARRLRKAYLVEWAWAIEENPKKTGYHIHAMQWGDYIPKLRLREMWGGRWIDIRKADCEGTNYVTKCAKVAGYMSKHIEKHLLVNGGRALHFTRGYLHGMTSRGALKLMASPGMWRLDHATPEEMANVEPRRWEDLIPLTEEEKRV